MTIQRIHEFEKRLVRLINKFGGRKEDFDFAADLLRLTANEMSGWARSYEEAFRIPDVIYDAHHNLRDMARKVERNENNDSEFLKEKDFTE